MIGPPDRVRSYGPAPRDQFETVFVRFGAFIGERPQVTQSSADDVVDDPIEDGVRIRVRSFVEAIAEEELQTAPGGNFHYTV